MIVQRVVRSRRCARLAGMALLACAALLGGGCGGGVSERAAQTTFLRSVDLVEMTDQMAQSFTNDAVIGARTPASDRWIISMDKLVNHTNQIIPEREKWLYLGRLRALLAQSNMAIERNFAWVIPPEEWRKVQAELGEAEAPPELRMRPTHLLTATFSALTNTSARGRSDTYHCSYQLVDLQSSALAWEGTWEVKRSIQGLTFD